MFEIERGVIVPLDETAAGADGDAKE